uniref:histidine kinase n=1 Tax=Chlorobium chlorochromatii (strain CaD3) TaxID=340177 RepID=Q3ATG6_CHLCH
MRAKASLHIGLVFSALLFALLCGGWWLLHHQFKSALITTTRTELQHNMQLCRQGLMAQPLTFWQSPQAVSQWLGESARLLNVRITLIESNGTVVADTMMPSHKLHQAENYHMRPEVKAALKHGFGEHIRFSYATQEQQLYTTLPMVFPDGRRMVICFSKPLYDVGWYKEHVQGNVPLLFLGMFVMSLGVGMGSGFLLTRPLRQLAAVARQRLQGDFSAALSIKPKHEFGELAHALNSMSDSVITMRRHEEWYLAVFSAIREAIIVTDAAGDIIFANPSAARTFRMGQTIFTSRPVKHLPDPTLQELFNRVHTTRVMVRKEEVALSTARGERIMQINSMPLATMGKTYEGCVFVLNDITTVRNLEKIRRDFVASVSHELRTPLTVISGYTETLLEGALHDPAHAVPFLKTILQASQQLTALVNDVLDLSRIESGAIDYQFTSVDIGGVVRKAVEFLKPSLEKKQIRLDVRITAGLPTIYADARYLDIVIRNLVDNAINAVDERNGRIRISAFAMNKEVVRLEVEDNGVGIAKADLDRIFERFYRVDKGRSRQYGGTGLGLSIVKHIVLAHQGDIVVNSKLNHGSVFSVLLKVAHSK